MEIVVGMANSGGNIVQIQLNTEFVFSLKKGQFSY